jgi:hypothetical protein
LELVWRALKENGASHIDVIFVHNRSPAEIKALRLALNRTAQDAVWDDQNLRAVLEDLISIDFDLDLTGFPAPEIDQRLKLDLSQANVEENGSDIPSVEEIAISARGTIWALGNHRIGCGDATDPIFVNRVLDNRLADVCFVDASYNLNVDGFISGKGKHRHREFVQGAGELSDDAFFGFLRQSLEHQSRQLDGVSVVECGDLAQQGSIAVERCAPCGLPAPDTRPASSRIPQQLPHRAAISIRAGSLPIAIWRPTALAQPGVCGRRQ